MLAGLKSAYTDIALFGKGPGDYAERNRYAAFLDEAAVILNRPNLRAAADHYRAATAEWRTLAELLLPDDVAPFGETRRLLDRRHAAFLEAGNGATAEMTVIDQRLGAIAAEVAAEFPMSQQAVEAHRGRIADQIMALHDVEAAALAALTAAMG
jgi:hypothetical protein